MFIPQVALWEIIARTVVVYVALLGGLRLAGKREIGQMTPFDLVVILLVANAVQNAMVGSDSSVSGGLVAALVLILLNYGLAVLRDRVPWLRRTIEGEPTILIHDGVFLEANMNREHVDREEVLMALREHGIDEPGKVHLAVLETDGSVSVVPASEDGPQRTRRQVRTRHKL